ncbi:MAG: hypothetical protein IKE04_05680 [Oscillospiraceae bacterium]|nr:hypothetical protein [Oscillospiraceae bacterium]
MKSTELAKQFAKEQGALFIESRPDWNGKVMWALIYFDPTAPDAEVPCIGYPQFVMIEDEKCTLLDPDEATAFMRYVDEHYGYTDEGEINGFEIELIRL